MKFEIILAFVGVGLTIISVNIAIVNSVRSDVKQLETEIRGWRDDIQKERKDFHGRLCGIEERKKK